MRLLLGCLSVALMVGAAPLSSDTELDALETADQGRAYQAVGRLDIGQTGFCTGTLISTDLVLTAAHCLFNEETGEKVNISDITFMPGLRNGRAAAYRSVRRWAIHPDYTFSDNHDVSRISTDLALLELSRPIRQSDITPLMVERAPRIFLSQVSLISYARDRARVPSLQQSCRVLDRERRIHVLSCDVDFGASGSPVFVTENGVPRVISVVSAMSDWRDQRVALAVSVRGSVEMLRSHLSESDGVFTREQPQIRSLTRERAMDGAGAKFLRP